MKKKTYCEDCNELVYFNIKEDQQLYDELFKINYLGTTCFCSICGNEVHDNEIDSINMKNSQNEYEKSIIKKKI